MPKDTKSYIERGLIVDWLTTFLEMVTERYLKGPCH
jgi:hypothetical protein